MAEFKIAPALSGEITAVKSAAVDPGTTAVTASGSMATLDTAVKYAKEHEQLQHLIDSFCALMQKDMDDLNAMVETAQKMDQTLAGSY